MAKVALQGQKAHEKRKLRSQGRVKFVEKMAKVALNRVVIPDSESTRSQLSITGLRSQKGPLGAELSAEKEF